MDVWAPLAEGKKPQLYAPGQLIYLQGTEASQFYYIMDGTVKCFLSAESGEERILTFHYGGELIGEASFFDRQPRVCGGGHPLLPGRRGPGTPSAGL